MAKGINKWIGIGNCCADPEMKYMPSGGAVTNITVACNNSYKDKNTGQVVDNTEFVRVVFFNKLAEIAGEYLRKGAKVYIEGSLRTRKWQAQDGSDRYTTEIVASEMQMLDGKQDTEQQQAQQPAPQRQAPPPPPQGQPQGVYQSAPAPQHAQSTNYAPRPVNPAPQHRDPSQGAYEPAPQGFDEFDDSIPF